MWAGKHLRVEGSGRWLRHFHHEWDRSWIAVEQYADEILLLLGAALDIDDGLRGIVDELLGLADVQKRDGALALLQLGELERLLPRGERALGDLELGIERQQLVIPARDAGDEAGDHRLAVPFGGEQIGAGRFGGAAELAPEVELPRRRHAPLEHIGVDDRPQAPRPQALPSGPEPQRPR